MRAFHNTYYVPLLVVGMPPPSKGTMLRRSRLRPRRRLRAAAAVCTCYCWLAGRGAATAADGATAASTCPAAASSSRPASPLPSAFAFGQRDGRHALTLTDAAPASHRCRRGQLVPNMCSSPSHNRIGVGADTTMLMMMRGGGRSLSLNTHTCIHLLADPYNCRRRCCHRRDICERGRGSTMPVGLKHARLAAVAAAAAHAGDNSYSSDAGDDEEGDGSTSTNNHHRFRSRRKVGISAALFATYFAVMFAKCALPATLPLLVGHDSGLRFPAAGDGPSLSTGTPSSSGTATAQAAMARVLSLSTIFLSIGKLVLGPVIDAVSGIPCLMAALFVLAGCLGTISQATTFGQFAVAWICVDFVFSACWAACLNAIHGTFDEEEWPGTIGMLAIAARCGNACAFFTFGALLGFVENAINNGRVAFPWMRLSGRDEPWRLVFCVSALIQAIPLALLSIFAPKKRPPPGAHDIDSVSGDPEQAVGRSRSVLDSLRVLRGVVRGPSFWLHLISRSALMVYASFLMFVPSLMTNCFGLSSSLAAKTGSLYALGCLLAVSVGSKRYNTLSRRGKIAANIAQLGTATLSALMLLLHVRGVISLAAPVGISLMFLWGCSFAVPFYIPSSMFALERGGKESSATISDCFDFFGFLCLAGFNGYVAGIQQHVMGEWSKSFGILASCSFLSMLCLTLLELIPGDD